MKKPPHRAGALGFNVAATYFSTCVPGSIIGPLELNCRVRDGNGCDLQGIATTKGTKTKGVRLETAPCALSRLQSGLPLRMNVID